GRGRGSRRNRRTVGRVNGLIRSARSSMTFWRSAAVGNASKTRLDKVVIRIAGDSGDGMQLAGDQFTSEAAAFGNDLATQPNYPAEIRAPQGTIHGVSSFQIQIADYDILTAGDRPDVLVAMNP